MSDKRRKARAPKSVVRLVIVLAAVALLASASPSLQLGKPEVVADGVELYRLDDPNLLTPPGPVAVELLRLDRKFVDLRPVLALGEVPATETVLDMARRHEAIAAINAGFFSISTGEPAGLLKIDGELVSDTPLQRGAVAITRQRGKDRQQLIFDQVRAGVQLEVSQGGDRWILTPDGIDTPRADSHLVWFTPHYLPDTRTPDTGTEWVLRGSPLTIMERRDEAGSTPVPRDGAVLSAGPAVPAASLERLTSGAVVRPLEVYRTALGSKPGDWVRARDIVGGAGLLIWHDRLLTRWTPERLREGFDTERHPRTLIGVDRKGRVWLITVDGRNPALSLGMSFRELQSLARRLEMRDALNLDGGGSTTMVVRDVIVNHPSDATGPRKVSDALLVVPRSGPY
jgi:hypothetical protein